MTIIRTVHENNFTIIANGCLQDDSLSAEALGILCYLLGRPNDWTVRPTQLAERFGCGRERIDRILKELISASYIVKTRYRDPKTQSWGSVEYTVYQMPQKPHPGNPSVASEATSGKPTAENPRMGFQEVLNTDLPSTDKQKEDGAPAPLKDLFPDRIIPPSEEKSYFDRSKEILGPKGSGLAAKLLKSQGKVIAKARAIIETSSTKSDAAAYIGAIIRGPERSEMGAAAQPGYGDEWW